MQPPVADSVRGRFAAVVFALVAVSAVSWLLAVPISSGADEPAHLLRAASLAGGELLGQPVSDDPQEPQLQVEVPDDVVAAIPEPACYAFEPGAPAACATAPVTSTPLPGDEDLAITTSGRHPPAYYALVGLPAAFGGGPYAMRAVAALACSLFFAAALLLGAVTRVPRPALLGVLAAITPMALYLSGVVNASNLEIAAATALWVALLVLARHPLNRGGMLFRPLLAAVGVAGVVMTLTRPVSALWLVVAVATAAMVARPEVLRALLRDRAAWAWAGVGGVASLASVTWLLVVGNPILESPFPVPPPVSLATALRLTLARTAFNVEQMIGLLGWLDAPLPSWVPVLWLAVVALLVAAAYAARRWWRALVLTGLIGASVVVPALLEAIRYNDLGIIWQGRYTLPLAVGVPILAGLMVADAPAPVRRFADGIALPASSVLAALHVVAFASALHRYTVGLNAPLTATFTNPVWAPPVPPALLLAVFTAAQGGLVWWCALVSRRRHRHAPAEQAPVPVATERPR